MSKPTRSPLIHTVPVQPLTDGESERFWAKVNPTGFCWYWTAGKDGDGYGGFSVRRLRSKYQAHRVAYSLLIGQIPEGLEIDHLCRNKACVNPDHLEPVTQEENRLRIPSPLRVTKGFLPPWVTSGKDVTGRCSRGHEYTEQNTYTYKDGRSDCRTCRRANSAAYRARLMAA